MQLHYHSNGCLTIDIQSSSSERSAIDKILNNAHQPEVRDFRMYIVACPNNGSENSTTIFRPTTRQIANDFDDFVGGFQSLLQVQPGEIVLMLLLLAVWACAVAYFLYRWRSMRIIQPSETRSKPYCPKNLETIKVVARHRDSVIYKSYTENMSRTMQARQKRLDRMNTMPNIKLGEPIQLDSPILRTKSLDVTATAAAQEAATKAALKGHGQGQVHGQGQGQGQQWPPLTSGVNRSVSTPSSFIDLASSCTNIMASIHMHGVMGAPIMEVEEETETQC